MDGAVLREWRRSRGWDVPEMARRLRIAAGNSALPEPGSLKRMIWRWEREGLRAERYELLYARALGISPEELAISPVKPGVSSLLPAAGSEDEEDPVKRREFGITAMGLFAGSLAPRPSASVSAEHVRALREVAASLWTRDGQLGGSALLREAKAHYGVARAMLDGSRYSGEVGAELQAVTAELAASAGFIAYDAAEQGLARSLLIEAALLAGSAGESLLTAQCYSLLALQSAYLAGSASNANTGLVRESLRFLDQASGVARHESSPKVHAIIAMRRARAYGILGDQREANTHIAAARRELDRGGHANDPQWARFAGQPEVTGFEGLACLALGQVDRAVRLFSDLLTDPAMPARNRAVWRAELAAALAAGGDHSQGTAEGLRVLSALEGSVKSARTVNKLRPVRQRAARDSEFAIRFDAVAAAS